MHRLIQPECPDCHAKLAEHERRCQNCGSTAIVDLGIYDIVRGERGSWLLVGILAVTAVLLVLIDRTCGTNMAASTWQFFMSRQ